MHGCSNSQGDRVVGAIMVAADLLVWTLLVPGQALSGILPG